MPPCQALRCCARAVTSSLRMVGWDDMGSCFWTLQCCRRFGVPHAAQQQRAGALLAATCEPQWLPPPTCVLWVRRVAPCWHALKLPWHE